MYILLVSFRLNNYIAKICTFAQFGIRRIYIVSKAKITSLCCMIKSVYKRSLVTCRPMFLQKAVEEIHPLYVTLFTL